MHDDGSSLTPEQSDALFHEHYRFPNTFPMKVFVKQANNVEHLLREHLREMNCCADTCDITIKPSAKGNYLSMTLDLHVQNTNHLKELYVHVRQHPLVMMTL